MDIQNQKIGLKYLGEPVVIEGESNMYCSPFREKERTASFSIHNEKGFHDFGTGTHYNQVQFVSELFKLSEKEAVKKITTDFNLVEYSYKEYSGKDNIMNKKSKINLTVGDKAESVLCMFDSQEYTNKPTKEDIPRIKNRIDEELILSSYPIEKIKELLIKGHTAIPSGIKGNAKENWRKQQMFFVDIDNTIDKKDIYVDDERHVTVTSVIDYCKEKNILPNFIYYTFSHTENQHKFRIVYVLEEPIENLKLCEQIPLKLLELLKDFNPDPAPKNLSSMFFGGREIVYSSDIYYRVEETEIDNAVSSKKEQSNIYIEELDITYKIPYGYKIKDEMIMCDEGHGYFPLTYTPVYIKSLIKNLDTSEEKLELIYYRDSEWKTVTYLKSILFNSSQVLILSNLGISLSNKAGEKFSRYLLLLEVMNKDVIIRKEVVSKLGWKNGQFIPFNDKERGIGLDIDISLNRWVQAFKSKGKLEKWTESISEYRKNNVFRFILASSFASPLLKLLDIRGFMVYNWGDSRAGKTACMKTAMSVWGNPEELTTTYNTTIVGVERLADLLNNIPLFIDEKQVCSSQNQVEQMIYMLVNGVSKGRGNKTGGVQTISTWKNIILSTRRRHNRR